MPAPHGHREESFWKEGLAAIQSRHALEKRTLQERCCSNHSEMKAANPGRLRTKAGLGEGRNSANGDLTHSRIAHDNRGGRQDSAHLCQQPDHKGGQMDSNSTNSATTAQ